MIDSRFFPGQIKIGNFVYKIRLDRDEYLTAKDLMGEIDYAPLTISIMDNLSYERKVAVLLHEIVHGLMYEMGLSECNDESLVDPISLNLYRLLMENDFSWMRS